MGELKTRAVFHRHDKGGQVLWLNVGNLKNELREDPVSYLLLRLMTQQHGYKKGHEIFPAVPKACWIGS